MWADLIMNYAAPVLSAVSTAGAIFMWLMRRSFASREDVEQLDDRLLTMETRMSKLPNQYEVHALKVEITELRGDLKETNASLRAVAHQNQLLLEKVIKRSGND